MQNIIDFIKSKIYYFLGGTILIIVVLIIVSSCSGAGSSYSGIEEKMVNAAKKYYETRSKKLPIEENSSVKVTLDTLIDAELLKKVVDPKNKSNVCDGYVEVVKVGDEYSYMPFLTCEGNYEPAYLSDKIKAVELDEYGNGVYSANEEYIYKGVEVDNYVSFNDMIWRIIKVDAAGDIKLIANEKFEDSVAFDERYNSSRDDYVGITTDYLHSNLRKTLDTYYKNTFTTDNKAKIVAKNLCIGSYESKAEFSVEKECSKIQENEKIGVLNATDYKNASLNPNCIYINSKECSNDNYIYNMKLSTWLLNPSSSKSYLQLSLSTTIGEAIASNEKRISPVIYITGKSVTVEGDGTLENPYIIK